MKITVSSDEHSVLVDLCIGRDKKIEEQLQK